MFFLGLKAQNGGIIESLIGDIRELTLVVDFFVIVKRSHVVIWQSTKVGAMMLAIDLTRIAHVVLAVWIVELMKIGLIVREALTLPLQRVMWT